MYRGKLLIILSSFVIISGLAACGGDNQAAITSSFGDSSSQGSGGTSPSDIRLLSISVIPADPQIAENTNLKFTAQGAYSDGTTRDITALVDWSSSDPTIVEIDEGTAASAGDTSRQMLSVASQSSPKLTRGKKSGSSTITASTGDVAGTTTVTVTSATLVSLMVTPVNSNLAAGATQQFIATGTFSDSTTQDMTISATWSSSDPSIATVGNTTGSFGLASAVSAGTAVITSAFGSIIGNASITVAAPLSAASSSLSWDAPTTYTDGSPIATADIKGYKIYFSTAASAYTTETYRLVDAPITSVNLSDLNLTPGVYFFVVTTLDSSDVESDFSNEVSKTVN